MTVEAWVNPSVLSGLADGGAQVRPWRADVRALRAPQRPTALGQVNTGGSDLNAFGTAALPLNTWTRLAVHVRRRSASAVRQRRPGEDPDGRGTLRASTNPLRSGDPVWWSGSRPLIDEVRIYNRALTQGKIQAGCCRVRRRVGRVTGVQEIHS